MDIRIMFDYIRLDIGIMFHVIHNLNYLIFVKCRFKFTKLHVFYEEADSCESSIN